MLAHQEHVQRDQQHGGGRQQQHVHPVEPRERDHADRAFAAQQAPQIRPDHRRLAAICVVTTVPQ